GREGEVREGFRGRGGAEAEQAFAVLVERHGPMVLRVCRAVLRAPHDAQDAFQATFLVLVRKAGSIRKRDSVASWLHGVACRVASCARLAALRRRRHEREAAGRAEAAAAGAGWDDLGPALHEELRRLPEKFLAPIVLCPRGGRTHEQAAQRLNWPVGTVRSRLARGRERLRERLLRRGLVPAVGALAAVASSEAAGAAVPAALVEATVR